MSHSAELLARLKPKAPRYEPSVAGGVSDLANVDIAAALSGSSLAGYYLALFKYVGDRTVLPQLERHWYSDVMTYGYAKGWWSDDQHAQLSRYWNRWGDISGDRYTDFCKLVMRLVRLVLGEVIRESVHSTCNGTGVYQRNVCNGCRGTGKKPLVVSEMLTLLQITRYEYNKRWEHIVKTLIHRGYQINDDTLHNVRRKLGNR